MSAHVLLYHPQVLKRLKSIHPSDQKKIVVKLEELGKNPFSKQLDIRKLGKTAKSFRLRVGNLRAIYELDKKKKNIYIWEIDYRGNIY